MSTSTSTSSTAECENPIKKWGLSTDIRNLDTIMVCLTSSHTKLFRADVTELLTPQPIKYGAMTMEDVKEVFDFYFARWRSADGPWGVWSDRYLILRSRGTPSEALADSVQQILVGARDELGMSEEEQRARRRSRWVKGGWKVLRTRRKVDVPNRAEEYLAKGCKLTERMLSH